MTDTKPAGGRAPFGADSPFPRVRALLGPQHAHLLEDNGVDDERVSSSAASSSSSPTFAFQPTTVAVDAKSAAISKGKGDPTASAAAKEGSGGGLQRHHTKAASTFRVAKTTSTRNVEEVVGDDDENDDDEWDDSGSDQSERTSRSNATGSPDGQQRQARQAHDTTSHNSNKGSRKGGRRRRRKALPLPPGSEVQKMPTELRSGVEAVASDRLRAIFLPAYLLFRMRAKKKQLRAESFAIATRPSAEALKRYSFFADWPVELLRVVATQLVYVHLAAGEVATYATEPTTHMLLIHTGAVTMVTPAGKQRGGGALSASQGASLLQRKSGKKKSMYYGSSSNQPAESHNKLQACATMTNNDDAARPSRSVAQPVQDVDALDFTTTNAAAPSRAQFELDGDDTGEGRVDPAFGDYTADAQSMFLEDKYEKFVFAPHTTGDYAAFTGEPSHVTVRAVQKCDAWMWPAASARALMLSVGGVGPVTAAITDFKRAFVERVMQRRLLDLKDFGCLLPRTLKQQAPFDVCSKQALQALCNPGAAELFYAAPGAPLAVQGRPADVCVLLRRGTVAFFRNPQLTSNSSSTATSAPKKGETTTGEASSPPTRRKKQAQESPGLSVASSGGKYAAGPTRANTSVAASGGSVDSSSPVALTTMIGGRRASFSGSSMNHPTGYNNYGAPLVQLQLIGSVLASPATVAASALTQPATAALAPRGRLASSSILAQLVQSHTSTAAGDMVAEWRRYTAIEHLVAVRSGPLIVNAFEFTAKLKSDYTVVVIPPPPTTMMSRRTEEPQGGAASLATSFEGLGDVASMMCSSASWGSKGNDLFANGADGYAWTADDLERLFATFYHDKSKFTAEIRQQQMQRFSSQIEKYFSLIVSRFPILCHVVEPRHLRALCYLFEARLYAPRSHICSASENCDRVIFLVSGKVSVGGAAPDFDAAVKGGIATAADAWSDHPLPGGGGGGGGAADHHYHHRRAGGTSHPMAGRMSPSTSPSTTFTANAAAGFPGGGTRFPGNHPEGRSSSTLTSGAALVDSSHSLRWQVGDCQGFSCLVHNRWARPAVAITAVETLELRKDFYVAFLKDLSLYDKVRSILTAVMFHERDGDDESGANRPHAKRAHQPPRFGDVTSTASKGATSQSLVPDDERRRATAADGRPSLEVCFEWCLGCQPGTTPLFPIFLTGETSTDDGLRSTGLVLAAIAARRKKQQQQQREEEAARMDQPFFVGSGEPSTATTMPILGFNHNTPPLLLQQQPPPQRQSSSKLGGPGSLAITSDGHKATPQSTAAAAVAVGSMAPSVQKGSEGGCISKRERHVTLPMSPRDSRTKPSQTPPPTSSSVKSNVGGGGGGGGKAGGHHVTSPQPLPPAAAQATSQFSPPPRLRPLSSPSRQRQHALPPPTAARSLAPPMTQQEKTRLAAVAHDRSTLRGLVPFLPRDPRLPADHEAIELAAGNKMIRDPPRTSVQVTRFLWIKPRTLPTK